MRKKLKIYLLWRLAAPVASIEASTWQRLAQFSGKYAVVQVRHRDKGVLGERQVPMKTRWISGSLPRTDTLVVD